MAGSNCMDFRMTPETFSQVLLADKPGKHSFPVSASLDLTSRCNLQCRHCFLRYNGVNLRDKSTRQTEQVLETLRDFGVLFLVLTGGDPFCRPDFKPLYQAAKRCGFFLTIFSNGTLLDDTLMDFLADLPPRRIELTAYGHTEETYEAVTGVPGSYHRFRRAVDGLLQRGILLRLKTMVLRTNAHELENIQAWALGLGCDFRYDAIIHPCLNGDPAPLNERISPGLIAGFRRRDSEHARFPDLDHSPEPSPHRRRLFECGAGLLTAHVDAAHQAHPCMTWRWHPFDLTGNPTLADWQAHISFLRDQPAPGGRCDTCPKRARCQSCAAYSVLETGSATGTPEFFCDLVREEQKTGD